MKLERENVLYLEHKAISDLCLWDSITDSAEMKERLLGYIDGVNTMATLVMDLIKELSK